MVFWYWATDIRRNGVGVVAGAAVLHANFTTGGVGPVIPPAPGVVMASGAPPVPGTPPVPVLAPVPGTGADAGGEPGPGGAGTAAPMPMPGTGAERSGTPLDSPI